MFCKNCGEKLHNDQNFCSNCGEKSLSVKENETGKKEAKKDDFVKQKKSSRYTDWIIAIFFIMTIVVSGIYGSLDDETITKNNEGLSSFETGDSQAAINQLKEASLIAVSTENKINTLKNLAYIHVSEVQNEEALPIFKEALSLTRINSFDYYLILGEIALLENKPDVAIEKFNSAYKSKPNDYQINSTLALFYIDIDELDHKYIDYKKGLFHAQKAIEYDIDNSETSRQNLAIAYYYNENFDKTISVLSGSNLLQHPHAAYWLGLAYFNKEDDLNARIYFQKAVDGGVDLPQEVDDYLNFK